VTLDGIAWGRLAVAPETGRWRVLSDALEGMLVRFGGFVGRPGSTRTEWIAPMPGSSWEVQGMAGSGPGLIGAAVPRPGNSVVTLYRLNR
jgi:hypothetical protein